MKFFSNLYFRVVQWFATFLINRTNTVLRHLITLKGKDPDFVVPPPQPPPPANLEVSVNEDRAAWIVSTKQRPMRFGVGSASLWVSQPESHPILQARKAYEDKLAKQAAEKAAKEAQSVELTEVGANAIDALRSAVGSIEQELQVAASNKKD